MSYGTGVLLIIVCLIFSAYFSATETAFNTVNRIKLKNMAEKGDKNAILVQKLLNQYENFITTILIGNNIVNISATSIATVLCVKYYGEDKGPALATLYITILILIFGEITPKTVAVGLAETFSRLSAPFLKILLFIFMPITFLFGLWQKAMLKIFKPKDRKSVTDDEILTIVKTAEEEGEIDKQESALIYNSIDFNETLTEEILTPRVDIEAAEEHSSKQEVKNLFARTKYSRIPVYRKDVDHIIGVLYQKDFYNKVYESDKPVNSIIRPVIYTSEYKPIGELFRELQKKKIHMAVVIDEYGGTRGIVTMEDILEELVGEIWDEHEEAEPEFQKLSDKEYRVSGSGNLAKLYEKFNLEPIEDPEAVTVSGWLIDEIGHLPKAGDSYKIGRFSIRIRKVDSHVVEEADIKYVISEKTEEE